jgi:beta-lactamase regulating signal transducer with metallopeptidase domain
VQAEEAPQAPVGQGQAGRWAVVLVCAAWVAGVLWQLARLGHGLWLVRRLARSLRPPAGPRWAALAAEAARRVGLRRPPRVAVSDLAAAPLSLGLLRPVVVLPAALEEEGLDDGEALGVLLHESAHVARRDHLVGLLQRLAGAALWWHPLVGALCRELDGVAEEVCDNHVVRAQGNGLGFARCLVKLAEQALQASSLPATVGALGAGAAARGLEGRVIRLLRQQGDTLTGLTRKMALALGAFVLAGVGLATVAPLKAEAPPVPAAAPEEEAAPAVLPVPRADSTENVRVEAKPNRERLVGTWKVVKLAPGFPMGKKCRFTSDGKVDLTMNLRFVGKMGKGEFRGVFVVSTPGTYEIDGDRMKIVFNGGGTASKGRAHLSTITLLNDNELKLRDGKGKTIHFRK